MTLVNHPRPHAARRLSQFHKQFNRWITLPYVHKRENRAIYPLSIPTVTNASFLKRFLLILLQMPWGCSAKRVLTRLFESSFRSCRPRRANERDAHDGYGSDNNRLPRAARHMTAGVHRVTACQGWRFIGLELGRSIRKGPESGARGLRRWRWASI